MFQTTLKRTIIIGLASAVGFAGITACDAPEESEAPAVEAQEAQEAPEAPGQLDDQLAADDAPDLGEAPGPEGHPGPIDGPEAGDQPPMPMGGDHQGEVTDEDLDNFGEAIESIQEIHEEGDDPQQRMQQADSPQEAQEIQQEVMAEMQGAVQDSGMEFQEFVMMAQRLQQDPELQQRLADRVDMEELMGPGPNQPQQQPAPAGQPPSPQPAPAEQPPAEGGDELPLAPGEDDE